MSNFALSGDNTRSWFVLQNALQKWCYQEIWYYSRNTVLYYSNYMKKVWRGFSLKTLWYFNVTIDMRL
jgi:hypothetical protein